MKRKALRRKTDQRSHEQRVRAMTTEEKQAAFLYGLCKDVSFACDKWLKARGIAAPSFAGEYPGKGAIASPEQSSAQPEGTQQAEAGGIGKLERNIPKHRVVRLLLA
jgi:hypothetical protein